MVKLMNCAHCGSDNVKLLRTIEDNEVLWHVECIDCGISTISYPEPCIPNEMNCSEEDAKGAMEMAINSAVTMWNSRVNVPCNACEYANECDDDDCEAADLSVDDAVNLAKKCIDILFKSVHDAMKNINNAMEDKHD